jgi:hypothetical protein
MKNPFMEQPQKPVDEAPKGVLIAVSANCMICDEQCDEAEYFPVEKVLVWYCKDEHKSLIENFSLGAM